MIAYPTPAGNTLNNCRICGGIGWKEKTMGVPGPSIEQYAQEKADEKAQKAEGLFESVPKKADVVVPDPAQDEKGKQVQSMHDPSYDCAPPKDDTHLEPSKTVEGKVDVVQDGKVIGSQG